jgi:hypothetical protein
MAKSFSRGKADKRSEIGNDQPVASSAASRTWRIQASAFSLAMRASTWAVAFRLFSPKRLMKCC